MRIGVIGGSGFYRLESLKNAESVRVTTPFGSPSDEYLVGKLKGREVVFLPRHGRGHTIMPSEINHRANIYGMKKLGVERIVSFSAVGSFKEELRPCDLVLPDQYFDRTKQSDRHTFFGGGIVAHIPFSEPACPDLRRVMARSVRRTIERLGLQNERRVQEGGTYVNMEGPAFSTRAESLYYKSLGFDVIGMTSLAEAKLCREAEICYQALAMVTDYDCWHVSEAPVTVEMIMSNLKANSLMAAEIILDLAAEVPAAENCSCRSALKNAIVTDPALIPADRKKELALITGRYIGA